MDEIKIEKRDNINKEIFELLLTADPSRELINDYIARGCVFTANFNKEVIGVYVLLKTKPDTYEIMNIAVKENHQNKGVGKFLLKDAINRVKDFNIKRIEIGTGNSSIHQLALYQKVGFRITDIDKGYFLKHYDKPIFENNVQCKDMIRMSIEF
ncbi:MAG: GNAT family N-acetyltransferase [Bacillota bacterium]